MYEYLCDSCHHRFDIKQKFTDDSLTICPNCGQRIHRVIQPAKVVFKGSGFYITDHKGSSAVLDSSKSEAKADTKAAEGAEAKPAAADKAEKADKTTKTDAAATASSTSATTPAAPSTGSSAPTST